MICTVCGREHRGQMREGCTGPSQRFVTPAEYARMTARPAAVALDWEKFKAERTAAKLAARDSDREYWWLL